jgi:hypothetical protein
MYFPSNHFTASIAAGLLVGALLRGSCVQAQDDAEVKQPLAPSAEAARHSAAFEHTVAETQHSDARLAPGESDDAARRQKPREWYGWQTLIIDGLSILVTVTPPALDLVSDSVPAVLTYSVGISGLFLGTPIAHWAHGNIGQGFASLGLRVAAAATITAGLAILWGGDEEQRSRSRETLGYGTLLLGGLGGLAIMIVDSAVFAYAKPRPDEHAGVQFGLQPWIEHSTRSGGLRFTCSW